MTQQWRMSALTFTTSIDPLYNADFDKMRDAENMTRILVARTNTNATDVNIILDDVSGSGGPLQLYNSNARMYFQNYEDGSWGYKNNMMSYFNSGSPFVYAFYNDNHPLYSTNAEKMYFDLNGTTYTSMTSFGSVGVPSGQNI